MQNLSKSEFVAKFGGVFEHSPWIAERAWSPGVDATHISAKDVHGLLVGVFRKASEAERLGVLRAHPDLAGRLAAARRLTAESAKEQAGAGLNALTDEERAHFRGLNATYIERFGFPFILAVSGLNKAEILTNFETRINNNRPEEFETACAQVERIAYLRLHDMLED